MDYKRIIELMITYLEEGVIVVDSNLNIIYFNEPSINISGFNPRQANGGTLFLDELNSMNLELQSKLLRVIEEKILREDLYYRLNVIYLCIHPLRDRKEDIPILVEHFINTCNIKMNKCIKGVDRNVMEYFFDYDWHGNVRELKNIIESAMNFVESEYITLEDIQMNSIHYINRMQIKSDNLSIPNDISLKDAVEEYEKHIIQSTLKGTGENCAMAARTLKIPKQTLHGKAKKYGLL